MTKNEIKALVSLLDDPDHEVARHVEDRLVSLGEEAIPSLEEVWEESLDPEAQRKIEDLIHSLQFRSLHSRLVAWKESGAEDLLEGLWLVSSYQYPDVDYGAITKQMEQIYYEAWLHIKPDMHPFDQVKALNHVMFRVYKFSANSKNFHSPANSMLNVVLESKRGNPLTLCAIYMTIAHKLELPIYGVNLPNIFLLTYKNPEYQMQFYINVYNKGLILSKADIENYVQQLNLSAADIFFEPCNNLDIVKRALRNLVVAFEKVDEEGKAAEVTMLLDAISEGESGTEQAADEDDEEDV